MLRRRDEDSFIQRLQKSNRALREEIMLLQQEVVAAKKENELLKEQLMPLIEQVQIFSQLIDWETLPSEIYFRLRSASQTGDFMRMYESLPDQFTLDDFISACEETDVNVFVAYEHIRALLNQDKLIEQSELFVKKPQP